MTIGVPGDHINSSDPYFITTLLHETGLTLGFTVHEHLRPGVVERIDETKAIEYYRTKFGWTEKWRTA
ncbi:hypothetical protein PM082_011851 [Marasmius tenuissimus]|nr:hypothetical protein PM082_011851 [Marasmius tenuissimus]